MKKNRISFLVLIFAVLMLALATPAQAATVVLPGLPPVAVPEPPYSGAVLYLPFDEGSGNVTYNAVDPTINNATLGNGTDYMPQWVPGKLGYGLQLNGNTTYATTQNTINFTTNSTGYTFLAWVKPDYNSLNSSNDFIFGYPFKIGLSIREGVTTYGVSGWLLGTYVNQGSFTYGKWHHFTVVYFPNSSIREVYADGKWIGNDTSHGSTLDWNVPVTIGNSNNQQMNGTIDEVMVFNRSLSPEEIQLLYQRGASYHLDVKPNIRQITVPFLDLSSRNRSDSLSKANFDISTAAANAIIPIPSAATDISSNKWAYTIDGKVLKIDDNRYINATSVNVSIPLKFGISNTLSIPNELYLDKDAKTFEYTSTARVSNPSDINVMAALDLNPSQLGVSNVLIDGSRMSMIDGQLISPISLSGGEAKTLNLSVIIPMTKQEIEYRSTLDDFLKINSYKEALTLAKSASEGKVETVSRVISIDSGEFGNRSVIIPVDARAKDVIEARAITGSRDLLEIRDGQNGKAEIVVPSTAFSKTGVGMQHAELKIIYTKKPSLFERLGLSSLASLIEKIKSIFLGGR